MRVKSGRFAFLFMLILTLSLLPPVTAFANAVSDYTIEESVRNMEKAYARMSQDGIYRPELVNIKSGSQMEDKWLDEIDRHWKSGSVFEYGSVSDITIDWYDYYSGKVTYISVIRGVATGKYYQTTMHVKFRIVDGRGQFYEEWETDAKVVSGTYKENTEYEITKQSFEKDFYNAIRRLDEGYAKMSRLGYYDGSLVPIVPGSQMEDKWKAEIKRHASTGSSFDFIESKDFNINMGRDMSGSVSYVTIIRGRTYGKYYQSTMYLKFEYTENGFMFYNEYETDSKEIDY